MVFDLSKSMGDNALWLRFIHFFDTLIVTRLIDGEALNFLNTFLFQSMKP